MAAREHGYEPLFLGDPAPLFRAPCIGQAGLFSFDMAAGRFVALCFYDSAGEPGARATLDRIAQRRSLFDGARRSLFGVSSDPADAADPGLAPSAGLRHFMDQDGAISRAFGVAPKAGPLSPATLRLGWFILDPRLRLIAAFPLGEAGDAAALDCLAGLPDPAAYFGDAPAPALVIPHVFEPDFCRRLIAAHQAGAVEDSAMLTEGATITAHGFKRRRDLRLADPDLVAQTQTRIFRRVVPEIRHAFQFAATRLERLIVACYDAAEGGRFGPHRDDTVAATGHRRFAVSINLNDDYEGGGLVFPEYSARVFRPPLGGALVFSCSLMHAVTPVTRGRRYACLPFVYDEAAAALRQAGKPG